MSDQQKIQMGYNLQIRGFNFSIPMSLVGQAARIAAKYNSENWKSRLELEIFTYISQLKKKIIAFFLTFPI